MIVHQLRTRFNQAESISRELAEQFQGAFQHYRALRDDFLSELPSHLHGSELVTLVNVDVKGRLFHAPFCEQIQDELKSLRRTLIRLEDLRAAQRNFPSAVNDLEQLATLGERAEALYQRHWEHYRYPTHLNEEALAAFLMDIHRLCEDWDTYFARFSAVNDLVDSLTGQALPAGTVALRIAYTQAAPLHFSVGLLKTVMDFLDAGYSFAMAVHGLDPVDQPLMLLQIDVAEPVELAIAVPAPAHDAYVAFLQYVFLKDMLKRETLLKYVLEAVERQFGGGHTIDSGALQKDLAAKLKALPSTGRFTISGRSFPDDQILVLQDLTATLERNQMDAGGLLSGDKPKATRKGKPAPESAPAPMARTAASPPAPAATIVASSPAQGGGAGMAPALAQSAPPQVRGLPPTPKLPPDAASQPRQHLSILTTRLPD